jgi:hypothetical protein
MTIHANVTFTQYSYDCDPCPVQACLSWSPTDPVAVTVDFFNPASGDTTTWRWARDLLANGALAPAGVGDVRIAPVDDELRITLSPPSGHADFAVDADVICEFLDETYAQIPGGSEFDGVDVEAELLRVLEGEAA